MNNNENEEALRGEVADAPSPLPESDSNIQTDSSESSPRHNFVPNISDFIFALMIFVVGYLFVKWVLASWLGVNVFIFTVLYLGTTLAYFLKKGVKIRVQSWFWFAAVFLTGFSCALWENSALMGVRALFLLAGAVYWVLHASGATIEGKTGNFLLLDAVNAGFIIPFGNFLNQYKSFSAVIRPRKKRVGKTLSILGGVIIAAILLAIIIPLLVSADSGGFSILVNAVSDVFKINHSKLTEFLFYCIPSIPTSAYIYGLVSGCVHKRRTRILEPATVKAARFLPSATVYIVLGAVSLIYVIFILCQLPYFFSAFGGSRPDGWLVYSAYAREGFFELCEIALINIIVIFVANLTIKKNGTASAVLKILNIILSLITLLLIATAMSKMALYIDAYGLTIRRLLPCAAMVFIALVYASVIALQKWKFSIVRLGLTAGAVIMVALFLLNPNRIVIRYNTDRFLNGTLPVYDTAILYESGMSGVLPAIEVLNATNDENLKVQIRDFLNSEKDMYRHTKTPLESFLERDKAMDALEKTE